MFFRDFFSKALLLGLSFFLSYAANAQLTQVSVLIGEKECNGSGIFTTTTGKNGFSDCQIIVQDSNSQNQYLHNIIIKYDGDLLHSETSKNYPGVADDAFKFTNTKDSGKDKNVSGDWEYNNGVPTYPDIRFWLAKSGSGNSESGFILFWMVSDNDIKNNTPCTEGQDISNLSFECMSLAKSVTNGAWTTPNNKGLSHITYFGGLCSQDDIDNLKPNCTPTTSVPEPTSIALFALALLGVAARRKNSIS
jgi:hypothetical protein